MRATEQLPDYRYECAECQKEIHSPITAAHTCIDCGTRMGIRGIAEPDGTKTDLPEHFGWTGKLF